MVIIQRRYYEAVRIFNNNNTGKKQLLGCRFYHVAVGTESWEVCERERMNRGRARHVTTLSAVGRVKRVSR